MDLTLMRSIGEQLDALRQGIKGILELKERVAVDTKAQELLAIVGEAQSKLIQTQAAYFAAASEVEELKAKLVAQENWAQEKERYQLHQLAPGALVYRVRPACQGDEPPHDLCPQCYQEGVKSILQAAGYVGFNRVLHCHRCQTSVQYRDQKDDFSVMTSGPIDDLRGF